MEKPVYNITASDDGLQFFFDSVSNEKVIKKVVAYFPVEERNDLYQLVFGNLLLNGKIDVSTVDNNQDMITILTTVADTMPKFFNRYPDKNVVFTGSTKARTRLYRAVISKMAQKKELSYEIFGILDDSSSEIFDSSHNYYGFVIRQKNEKNS